MRLQTYRLPPTQFIEAVGDAQGWVWRTVLIAPGESKNRTVYSEDLLRRAAPLFEGVRALARSDEDHHGDRGVHVRDVCGWFDNVAYREGEGIAGDFHITADAQWLRDKLVGAAEAGKLDLLGFSIVATGFGRRIRQGDMMLTVVDELQEARFVDVVVCPAAGGRFLAMAEAVDTDLKELLMLEKLWQIIEGKRPELLGDIDKDNVTEDELMALMESHWMAPEGDDAGGGSAAVATQPAATRRPTARTVTLASGGAAADDTQSMRLSETLQRLETTEARILMREALGDANLPQPVRRKLESQFQHEIEAGAYPTPERLRQSIEAERAVLTELAEAGRVEGFGRSRADIVEDATDKAVQRLNDFFDRKPGSYSFKEAYIDLTGDTKVTGRTVDHDSLEGLRAYAIKAGMMSVAESVTTSGFDVVLASTLHRRMVEEYTRAPFNTWRLICDIGNLSDMRQQHRVRYGGYGDLPTVTEGADYTALTTPADEEATYTPTKKGGTESITLEAIWNDDVQAIRRIPQRLGRSAARTLYKFVFNTLIADNPTIYDSVALFHATHNNLTSTAFSATQFMVHRVAMQSQTEAGSSEVLGIVPRFLLVPPELEEGAFDAFVRDTNNDAQFVQTVAPTIITVSEWTDANDWFSVCDPMDCPTIEIGFFDGEEPQLFRQDMPSVGSVFTNDTITWKIRHIFGGANVDFRGMQGAVVA